MAFDLATAKPMRQGFDLSTAKPGTGIEPAPTPTAMNRVDAVTTGVNRGLGTRLLGLPVDTVTNVLDLLKAGVGTAYQATTGKPADDWLLPYDRTQIVGTGDWIEKKVRDMGGSRMIDPSGPVDGTTRVLHSVGMGIGGAIGGGRLTGAPMSNIAMARNAGAGGLSGGAGAIATENGASPAVSILASMGPQLAGKIAVDGTKAIVRGNEAGRREMEQRIFDLKEAGIDSPSLGLSSGNSFIAGLENIMSKVPGSVGLYADHRAKMIEGMMNKGVEARDLASARYGSDLAGRAIQNDLVTGLKPRITDGYDRVTNQLVSMIPSAQRFPITNSLAALSEATSVNPTAPATTASFVQPRIAALRENMLADTQSTTHSV